MRRHVAISHGTSRGSGFTLVELLVVIGIIGLLAAILLPALTRAMGKAEEARAATEVKTIETAVKAYLNEYGKFPHGSGATVDYIYDESGGPKLNRNLMNVLRAIASADGNPNDVNNPRDIVFLEIPEGSIIQPPDSRAGGFWDPWDNEYRIVVDANFNNDCETGVTGLDTVQARDVLVWSLGPGGTGADPADYIKSWK